MIKTEPSGAPAAGRRNAGVLGPAAAGASPTCGRETKTRYAILDIDLDYFNLMRAGGDHFRRLLAWAGPPVVIVVERHNHAFAQWRPRWVEDETWDSLRHRFTHGPARPARWPKPDVVAVCTRPDWIGPKLAAELSAVLSAVMAAAHGENLLNQAVAGTSLGVSRHR